MRRSTEKKLIVLTEKELIEKALDDIEEVTSLNSSTIIEDFIMKSIFPKNNAAKSWVTYMYKYNWKTNQVLEAVFEYLSAGINWKARYTNAFPLINFSHQLSYYSQITLDDAEIEYEYIVSQLDSIKKLLEGICSELEDDDLKKSNLESEVNLISEWIDSNKKVSNVVRISTIYNLIVNNWDILNDYTRTYRLLSALESIKKDITDTANIRLELINILKNVSDEWDS